MPPKKIAGSFKTIHRTLAQRNRDALNELSNRPEQPASPGKRILSGHSEAGPSSKRVREAVSDDEMGFGGDFGGFEAGDFIEEDVFDQAVSFSFIISYYILFQCILA
jgi:hypothetical protein